VRPVQGAIRAALVRAAVLAAIIALLMRRILRTTVAQKEIAGSTGLINEQSLNIATLSFVLTG
jgi:hypothetical protein